MAYEGYIKHSDDSVISVQCSEGRCTECPDRANHSADAPTTPPALDGYYCEHDCDDNRSISDAQALDQIQHMLRDPDWGVGMLEDIAELVNKTGRSTDNLPDDEPTWARH